MPQDFDTDSYIGSQPSSSGELVGLDCICDLHEKKALHAMVFILKQYLTAQHKSIHQLWLKTGFL